MDPRRMRWLGVSAALMAPLGSCRAADEALALAQIDEPVASYTVVRGDLAPDPEVEAIVQPYRSEYEAWAVEVVGQSAGEFTRGDPEATLDNLVADAILEAARRLSDRPVDMAMSNDGGLRADINEGPIYVSEVFQLMPFENTISVIDLTGHQVDSLAQQIARTGGEPVSGIRLLLSGDPARATDITVDGQPLQLDATYRLAVADYLVNGGGNWPQIWTPSGREDFTYLIRDAILEYVGARDQVTPSLDGRIRPENR